MLAASLAAIVARRCSPAGSAPPRSRCCSASACSACSLGIALLAPRLVKPLARVVGWPARRAGGVAGELAGANAVRNPGRTASTAAALMIGLTLVTVVAVLGSGISAGDEVGDHEAGPRRLRDRRQGRPAVPGLRGRQARGDARASTAASHVRSDDAIVQGKQRTISGIDPATIAHFYTFNWTTGSERTLGQLGSRRRDRHQDLRQGQAPEGRQRRCPSSRLGRQAHASSSAASTTRREASPMLGRRRGHAEGVRLGLQPAEEQLHVPRRRSRLGGGASRRRPKGYGDARYHTGAAYPKDATKDMPMVLAMLYVLLGFSVIVSLFGMVNTMVLSVFERTREIGMLRTIGMTRRQARRMIRHESIITALIGAALGIGLGLFLSGLVTQGGVDGRAPVRGPRPDAGRVHAARGHRRHRRGDHAGTAGLAAQRAGGAAVRVADPNTHRLRTPPPPSGRGGVLRR